MKRRDYEIERDYEYMLNDDEALFDWLGEGLVYDWFIAQPIYRERFLDWVRENGALIDKWAEHCSETVNAEGYNEPDTDERD